VVRTFIDPGFILTILFGGLGAAILDGRPVTAIVYGLASAFSGRQMLRPLLELLVRQYLPAFSFTRPPAPAATPATAKE
jgi:hypothetical protein